MKKELVWCARLLPVVYARIDWKVHPIAFAQDAQGASGKDAGGAGLVFSLPQPQVLFDAAMSGKRRGRVAVPGVPALDEASQAWHAPQASSVDCRSWPWWDFLSSTWRVPDHINLGELRAKIMWLEVIARDVHSRARRLLLLSDSAVAVGAWLKGRSSAWSINRLLRRRASLEVAAKVVSRSRWVPSEWQPGDRLSRIRRVTGPIVGLFRQALAHRRNS